MIAFRCYMPVVRKMAFVGVSGLRSSSLKNLISSRRVCLTNLQNLQCSKTFFVNYTTSFKKCEEPVKFIGSEASKYNISENLGLECKEKPNYLQYWSMLISITSFLIYFCILREENDIDEILKGNPAEMSEHVELCDLRIKLSYCKLNKIPSQKIEKKIQELEEKLGITVK